MAIIWEPVPELREIVALLKEKLPENVGYVNENRILYATYSTGKSRAAAKIGPIPAKYSIFLQDYDYMLEVHKQSWAQATEGERLYIILHELKHIPDEGFNKDSKDYKKLIRHDKEDFRDLIKLYGVDMEHVDKLVELVK